MAREKTESPRSIQWSMWANEMALYGSLTVVLGGIVGIIGGAIEQFQYWLPFGIYGLALGILVCVLEYPRGKKTKGSTVARSHQESFTKLNYKCHKVTKNYYVRALMLFLICLPAGVIVPTFFGAFCLLSASVVYLAAAIRDEKWEPFGIDTADKTPARSESISPPSKPPPRLPQQV